ncbi:MAG: DUF1080 domain-containing protein [Planctomycetales bacterium]|nr:DUF1080 domain-containing protein [Planctomycetales bacterium]
MVRTLILLAALVLLAVATVASAASPWTDASDPSLPADFKYQGEYVGQVKDGGKLGCQVIALSGGVFQAVVYPGGLPGAGWDGENKILMDGKLADDGVDFRPAEGNKNYLANDPAQFSATRSFPPTGHKAYSGAVRGATLSGKTDDGKAFELTKTTRASETLGGKPPQGAKVLFDGDQASMANWRGGRLDEKTKLLNTDGQDILTTDKFNNYTMHVEFMLPYKPEGRGQGRGNSGFYQVDHYEVQILDSFGLEGLNNECGGVYSQRDSLVNACLPPLVWQSYDVEFTNAVADDSGKKVKNARLTARLNGILIHDDYELTGKTGGSRGEPEGTPGPIKLQGHGNPLQFRNVWIVEKK